MIDVFPEQSLPGEYALVEQVDPLFTYNDFLRGKTSVPSERLEEVKNDFIEFARSTWAFSIIGDQHDEQIVYATGKGWVFIDFDSNHKQALKVDSGTVFTKGYDEIRAEQYYVHAHEMPLVIEKLPLPDGLVASIIQSIEEERLKNELPEPFSCSKWLLEKMKSILRMKPLRTDKGSAPKL